MHEYRQMHAINLISLFQQKQHNCEGFTSTEKQRGEVKREKKDF